SPGRSHQRNPQQFCSARPQWNFAPKAAPPPGRSGDDFVSGTSRFESNHRSEVFGFPESWRTAAIRVSRGLESKTLSARLEPPDQHISPSPKNESDRSNRFSSGAPSRKIIAGF